MKKKLLFLLLLLVPFLVFAKEEFSYGWDFEQNNTLLYGTEIDSEYYFVKPTFPGLSVQVYNNKGKYLKTISSEDYNTYDEVVKDYPQYPIIYSKMAGKYEGIYYSLDSEKSISYSPGSSYIYECPRDEECTELEIDSLSDAEIKSYLGNYYFIYDLAKNSNSLIRGYISGDYYIIIRKSKLSTYYLDIYNKDEKRIISKKYNNNTERPAGDINQNGIYITNVSYNHEKISATYEITKYDLNGKELYTEDITNLIKDNSGYDDEDLYYNYIISLDLVKNGVVLTLSTNYVNSEIQQCIIEQSLPELDGGDETISPSSQEGKTNDIYEFCEESVKNPLQSVIPYGINSFGFQPGESTELTPEEHIKHTIIIKLNMDYAIETKVVEGKGTIKAIGRSASGEGIVFEVVPEKGYVLSEVKVTDANGNVITFTDYKFTMPSADVLIEAKFIPENPNTLDAVLISIPFIIISGIAVLFIFKKVSWLK